MWNNWWEWNYEQGEAERDKRVNQTCAGERTFSCFGIIAGKCFRFLTTHPDVALAREEPLGDASGVQTGSGDVEHRHEQKPAHLSDGGRFDQTLADDEVQGGDHAAQTQAHKHSYREKHKVQRGSWEQ